MHDQRKVNEEVDQKTREQRLAQVQEFTSLYNSLLRERDKNVFSAEVLNQLSDLLKKNPEAYSMYNYRRNILIHLWSETKEEEEEEEDIHKKQEEAATEIVITKNDTMPRGEDPMKGSARTEKSPKRSKINWLEDELKLSSIILRNDYKVYAAFVHRRWIFAQIRQLAADLLIKTSRKDTNETNVKCPTEAYFLLSMLMKEKKQCDALLARDERNFHAWNYRRWALSEIAQMKILFTKYSIDLDSQAPEVFSSEEEQQQMDSGVDDNTVKMRQFLFTPEEITELQFTTKMIQRNFSNYSAWHQRGLIIKAAFQRMYEYSANKKTLEEAWMQLKEDLELLITAIYCDPVDQSAWYYAQFISRASETLDRVSFLSDTTHVDVTARLVGACIEIMTEERRLGDDTGMYWPLYYLFTALLSSYSSSHNSHAKGKDRRGGKTTAGTMAREICTVLYPNDEEPNKISNNNNDDDNSCRWCLQRLATDLVLADPLRAGMYKSLLATVTGCDTL